MSESILTGAKLLDMKLAEDQKAILFVTDRGEIIARCDADCCSYTWVEHIELPALGFPATVIAIADLDLPGSDNNHPEHDCLQVYGLKITTDRGDIIIDYRNSSNGYYGGSLTWPGEYHYGGVFGQNDSKENWKPISEPSQ